MDRVQINGDLTRGVVGMIYWRGFEVALADLDVKIEVP